MHSVNLLFVVLIAIFFTEIAFGKFPDDPKLCKYGDTTCLTKIINYFLQEQFNGDSSVNLVPIDPLPVSLVHIKQGAESPLNIDLKFMNSKMFGLKTAQVTKVNGFGKNLTEKHEIYMKIPNSSLIGDYSVNGNVLILPISGTGTSNITMTNVELSLHFSGVPKVKDTATYMLVKNLKINVKPGRVYYKFNNLFNGDKELGDNMNLFLNENWKDIFSEAVESLKKSFAKVFQKIINQVFEHMPYDKYFVE